MKKLLVSLLVVSSMLLIGCGGPEGEATVGGKQSEAPAPPPTKAGIADDKPMAAPPGVKTGTPGG